MLLEIVLFIIKSACITCVVISYQHRENSPFIFARVLRLCFVILLVSSFIAPSLKSAIQYTLWAHHPIGVYLLPPHRQISYFLFYVWGRFWFSIALALASSGALYGLFRAVLYVLKNRLDKYEIATIAFSAVIAGWPAVVFLVPFSLAIALSTALFQKIFSLRIAIHIGDGFLIAGIILFIFGEYIITLAGLSALRV